MDIDVALSADSLASLADRVERMAKDLGSACDAACGEVAEHAADVARAAAPVDTGALSGSIGTERTAEGYDVVCSAPYAAFAEFGTGLGSPAASAATLRAMGEVGWSINASGRGEEGWPFPSSRSETGWATTHGQSGKGFMGQGADSARQMAHDAFAAHVREVLGG